jgi:hypothetical protein
MRLGTGPESFPGLTLSTPRSGTETVPTRERGNEGDFEVGGMAEDHGEIYE